MKTLKKHVFSAVQPSGQLTIGNYIGVLCEWIKFQDKYSCFYCIADLHAITVRNSSNILKKNVLDTISVYLACGLDPCKSTIFLQSQVHEHSELYWLLTCYTYYGELTRMTQFKDKSTRHFSNINSGLFNYPILMASDILLYKTDIVPIGYDQKQHIELVRNIANRFNSLYDGNIFTIPTSKIANVGSNILSLSNPTKKMSKSDINKKNVIFLLDDIGDVIKKIKLAVTDSDVPPKIIYDMKKKAGVSNLLSILSCITQRKIPDIEKDFHSRSYRELKLEVIHEITYFLNKFQGLYFYFRNNEVYLKQVLYEGSKKASSYAKKLLKQVKISIGLF